MPWREYSVMDERIQFVSRRIAGESMAELCRDFGISRKTVWVERRRIGKFDGFAGYNG
jgi:hypothetical protein